MIKRNPLILGNKSLEDITNDICALIEEVPGQKFLGLLLSAKTLMLFYLAVMGTIVAKGMGLMGVNSPVGWGTDIITFVFYFIYEVRKNSSNSSIIYCFGFPFLAQ